jgi:hypothetical protein
MKTDDRDEALAGLLDRELSWLEPDATEHLPAIRHRGARRRAFRSAAAFTAVAVFVGSVAVAGLYVRGHRGSALVDQSGWLSYRNDAGRWTMLYPKDWRLSEFDNVCNPGFTGALVANTPVNLQCSAGPITRATWPPSLIGFPQDGVAVELDANTGPLNKPMSGPGGSEPIWTTLPLSIQGMTPSPAPGSGLVTFYTQAIRVAGYHDYNLNVWFGPGASAQDREIAKQMVASIAFDWGNNEAPTTPPPTPSVAPALVLPLGGPVTSLLSSGRVLYFTYSPFGNGNREVVASFAPGFNLMAHSGPLQSIDLAVSTNSVWASARPAGGGARELLRMDPRTLQALGTTTLPEAPGPLAMSPAGLWVGGTDHLYLLDPSDGHQLAVVATDGQVLRLSVDPTGSFLYAATGRTGLVKPWTLSERDARTGAAIASVPGPGALAVNSLSATTGGVWVSVGTGMLGGAGLYRQGDLHSVANAGLDMTNGTVAYLSGGILWVGDYMASRLWCADPATGAFRSSVALLGGIDSNVVVIGSTPYMGADKGIVRLKLNPACGLG